MSKAKKDVDYGTIGVQPTNNQKIEMIQREIIRVKVPSLTDALTNRESGGQKMLETLDKARKEGEYNPDEGSYDNSVKKWKLRKIQNEDGSPVKPGQNIRIKYFQTTRNQAGLKMGANDIESLKRRGLGAHYERYHSVNLDSDCCAEFDYADAITLLTQFGIHYQHRYPLNKHPYRNNRTQWEEVIDGVNDRPVQQEQTESKTTNVQQQAKR